MSFFDFLRSPFEEIQASLLEKPEIISQQDSGGKTLLHYAVFLEGIVGVEKSIDIIELLLSMDTLNLSIQDNEGNTPVHFAAMYSSFAFVCKEIFPRFIKKAAQCNFDFTTSGQAGHTVLHHAAKISYEDPITKERIDNVQMILDNVKNSKNYFNTLSSEGLTALSYAIKKLRFEEALALLPLTNLDLGTPEENKPVNIINYFLEEASKILQDKPEQAESPTIKNVYFLKNKIEEFEEKKELSKNARTFSIFNSKDDGNFFSKVPKDLLKEFAFFNAPKVPIKEANQIFEKHFPKQ